VGTIAGCHVTDGKIDRGQNIRVVRDGVVLYEGKNSSLRRFKDDVKEVQAGYECGIGIERFNDIKIGDVLECFYLEEIRPSIE
jgi:translation initiation factor IF-2